MSLEPVMMYLIYCAMETGCIVLPRPYKPELCKAIVEIYSNDESYILDKRFLECIPTQTAEVKND